MKDLDRPADFDKLPKRHKDYIQALEARVRAMESALPRMPSKVKTCSYLDEKAEVYLPDNARIAFDTPSGRIEVTMDKQIGGLEISAIFGMLEVRPRVANQILVKAIP